MNGQLNIFVGQYPLFDGAKIDAKAKYLVKVYGFQSDSRTTQGSNTASAVSENALNELSTSTSGTPQQHPAGSFVLSSGMKNDKQIKQADPEIALVFRVQESTF